MSKRILVFDFGASSARAMLCSYENGALSLEEIHRFANTPVMETGHLRWNIDELFTQMKTGMSIGVFNGGYDAVSIDTWGVDFGLLDRNGELSENPVHYRDSRTDGIADELFGVVSAEELFERTGIQPQNINTAFQLFALLKQEESTLFRAESLLMMPDLFAYLLTGEKRSELTEAATSQLIDRVTLSWDYRLINKLRLPRRLFCPIIRAGERIGFLKPELAHELRIDPIPVLACASHDTASAVVAVPSPEDDFLFISCGTWTLVGTELSKAIVTERVRKAGLTNERGCANTTMLLKNIMGLWLAQETRRYYNEVRGMDLSFADLENSARACEPFVSFIDPNDPSFTLPDDMPLKIAEYCRKTNQPVPETVGEVMRCIYQSLACEFALTADSISELTGKTYDKIYMIGGGTKDKLLCELTAQASGRTAVAGPAEATALGNGISSLIALGEIKDIRHAREIIVSSGLTQCFEPTEHNNWLKPLKRYEKLTRG